MIRNVKHLAIAGLLAFAAPALAAFPERPIRIVVAFPAGGTNDSAARLVGEKMQGLLGQPVIVENKPGAGGMIGAEFVASAAADGYTLFMASGGHTVLPAIHKSMRYDLAKDFVPIGLACTSGYAVVVRASSPAHTLAELADLARKDGNLSYATTGRGVLTHLAGEWLKQSGKFPAVDVPYKGDTPALADLLGGQVDYSVLSIPPSLPHIRQGTLRALAVTSADRSSALPKVPTIAEALPSPGYDVSTWFGLLAPAATPGDAVARLRAAMAQALQMPDVRDKFKAMAMEPGQATPEAFGEMIERGTARAAEIAKTIGIEPQ